MPNTKILTASPNHMKPRRQFSFPSAFTVLAGVTILVWLAALILPSGTYDTKADGGPIPGTYHAINANLSWGNRLMQLFLAPINGLYGVKNPTTGFIGPYESGELYGAAGVFMFVLAIGVFITMGMRTGAIENGIARVAQRFSHRGGVLIVILMVLFSIGGTTEGMSEETLGFYALLVPLMLSLGYDRMVAAGTILIGAGIGVLASTINPFSTGVASAAADISIGSGIGLRVLMYVVLTTISILYVLRYARRVKKDSSKSLVADMPSSNFAAPGTDTVLTRRQKVVLVVVGLTFAMMIFAIVPWAQVIGGTGAASYSWQLDWYFPELAALFIVASIVVGFIGGLKEKELTTALVRGAGDFIGVGLIIVLARGVTVIMNNAYITDTVLNSMENLVTSTSSAVFGAVMFLINLPLGFLIPSSSGHAGLAMPILAPLADFAGVSRAVVVTALQSAHGIINLVAPTSAVVMGGLALAQVPYQRYLRFIGPLLLILIVLCTAFVAVGAALS
ncbi:Na+/H+ antiporter NhaC family protein [Arthrobacter sp. LAPM80]|uniref:YfcC family protein n=1 Tax=Arthrobacter sp. LAPM80 TaxID=3141788 RepID=UPI00398B6FF4